MGIDPGTTTVGVSIFILNDNLEIVDRYSELLDMKRVGYVNRLNNKTDYKLERIERRVSELIHIYKPFAMVVEMPFMNNSRPQAVIPLARSLQAIIGAMVRASPNTPVLRPSPSNIKNAVGVSGGSKNKGDMTVATVKLGIANGDESEHEIDAIAANWYLLSIVRHNYMLPYLMD